MYYAVIGLSIAGIGAALRLVQAGQKVHLLPHPFDTATLIDMFLVGRTPLSRNEMPGEEYELHAITSLQDAGVVISGTDSNQTQSIDKVLIAGSGVTLIDQFRRTHLEFKAIVFAPNGTAPELRTMGQWKRGVSFSAASDVPLVAGRPVVVVGCGGHALQQTCIALNYASKVTLCCEETSIRIPNRFTQRLLDHARQSERLEIILNCRILPEQVMDNAQRRVRIQANNIIKEIDFAMLFLAHDPVSYWGLEDNDYKSVASSKSKLIFPSGLANAVDYMDHAALFRSGIESASSALGCQER